MRVKNHIKYFFLFMNGSLYSLTANNTFDLIISNFVEFTGILGNGGGDNQQRRGSGTPDYPVLNSCTGSI